MYNIKRTTVILSILLTSCGLDVNEDYKDSIEKEDVILSQTDSLLSFVDEEINNIIEENKKHEEEFHTLEDKVKEYESTIKLEQKSHDELINEIKILRGQITTKDSINLIISSNLEFKEYELKILKEKINYMNIKFREETAMYESMVFRLEDSLSNLEQKLIIMESFIEGNVRPSKVEKYLGND